MRSTRLRYSILLFLGLVPIILHACSSGASDPTPDTTIPSTLQVTVTIAEDQDASDGANGKSTITLVFNTNEVIPPDIVNFINGESVDCNGQKINLTGAPSYPVRIDIPNNPPGYECVYHYPLHASPAPIFMVHAAQKPLSPKLLRPVGSNPIRVSYTPDYSITKSSNCTIQVGAYAANGSATGNPAPQNGNIYTGPSVGGLSGRGYLVMTRTCNPVKYENNNKNDDSSSKFDALDVTYMSTATVEVTWA